jgi:hypothetical protein
LATGRRLDCIFVFEPGFISVVFILQWWPIILPPVLVLFCLITCYVGKVNWENSVQVQTNLRGTSQAFIILINFSIVFDEAWCGRTARNNVL